MSSRVLIGYWTSGLRLWATLQLDSDQWKAFSWRYTAWFWRIVKFRAFWGVVLSVAILVLEDIYDKDGVENRGEGNVSFLPQIWHRKLRKCIVYFNGGKLEIGLRYWMYLGFLLFKWVLGPPLLRYTSHCNLNGWSSKKWSCRQGFRAS